jgi:hypothetical protein
MMLRRAGMRIAISALIKKIPEETDKEDRV